MSDNGIEAHGLRRAPDGGALIIAGANGADTVFAGGWILPGLVDAPCHVGLGHDGEIPLDEAVAQAEAERDVGGGGVEAALRRYEATRKPRATEIQGNSRTNTWMRNVTDPAWVYGYDAWTTPLAEAQD